MKRKILIIFIVIILASLFQFWRMSAYLDEGDYVIADKSNALNSITTSGKITYPSMLVIKSEVSKKIENIFFNEGDVVKKNDIILKFDNFEEENLLSEAKINLKIQNNNLDKLKNKDLISYREKYYQDKLTYEKKSENFEDGKKLFDKGSISKKEYEDLKYEMDISKSKMVDSLNLFNSLKEDGSEFELYLSEIEKSEIALMKAEKAFENTFVKAPFDGIVLKMFFESEEYVNLGEEMLIFVRNEDLIIESAIDEKFLPKIKLGQDVIVRPEAFENTVFEGYIDYISPYIDEEKGTILIKIKIKSPPEYLKQDLTVVNEIIVEELEDVIMIGREFIVEDDGVQVLKYKDGKFFNSKIKISKYIGNLGVVESGIEEGDIILLPEKVQNKKRIVIKNSGE